jgi:F-type H+-transporting ATPase subunit epsilon
MAMRVEVVSPEKVIFSGECTQVATRTLGGGEIAFLEGHSPFLGALATCHTKIWMADGKVVDVAIHGGFVEVGPTGVSILSDEAELGGDIDVDRALRAKERAEERLRHEHDAEGVAALSRAHARLAAAGGIPASR